MLLIVSELSQAVCELSSSQHEVFLRGFQASVSPVWPPYGYTCPLSSHDRPAQLLLTAHGAAATAARETSRPRAVSRPDRSTRLPSLAYRAATASRSPCRWWVPAVIGAGVGSRGAHRNYSSNGRRPSAAAIRLRPCTAC